MGCFTQPQKTLVALAKSAESQLFQPGIAYRLRSTCTRSSTRLTPGVVLTALWSASRSLWVTTVPIIVTCPLRTEIRTFRAAEAKVGSAWNIFLIVSAMAKSPEAKLAVLGEG